MLRAFPLLAIMVVLYALLTFGGHFAAHDISTCRSSDVACIDDALHPFINYALLKVSLISKDTWYFKLGDLLLLVSLVLLFIEVVKATRTTTKELINHGLSMVTFVIALLLFITVKGFATSTFFLITMMTLFDVIAGYTISVVAAEHDLGMGKAGTD
jgi:hypothetical protein